MLPLDQQHLAWKTKPSLRLVYEDFHHQILSSCRPGRTLEVGSGFGALKAYMPEIIAFDIQPMPRIDLVADAHAMPFQSASFENIVGIDVLHHLASPFRFLTEALRVLYPSGRLILLEPAVTILSSFVYRVFHDEPIDMTATPLHDESTTVSKVENVNQAIPTLIFVRHRDQLAERLPELQILDIKHLSLWAYPLSGGFRRWSLMPKNLVRPLLAFERRLAPILGPYIGFRLLIVAERRKECS